MSLEIVSYIIRAIDGDGRIQHELEFAVKNFPDAKDRAIRHHRNIKKLWPEFKVGIWATAMLPEEQTAHLLEFGTVKR